MTQHVLYNVDPKSHVATITLDRPEQANAQNEELLRQLDEYWMRAEADEKVKVVLLNANGKHFSSGHDLSASPGEQNMDYAKKGVERLYAREKEIYVGYSMKWRNTCKPSICAVQGACIAGGLMLAWPCDIIVAADNAYFRDPVVFMGIGSVEFHAHTWEFGARKAKEMLFTGDAISAEEAHRLGAINKIVPADDLQDEALALAERIAEQPSFGLFQAKRMVNQTLDAQGFRNAIETCFDIQVLGHAHALAVSGKPVLPSKMPAQAKHQDKGE